MSEDSSPKPSPKEQKATIEQAMNTEKIKLGDTWYVLSTRWYNIWKDYVKFDESDGVADDTPSCSCPDRIDNSDIMLENPKTADFIALKSNLTEEFDYVLISPTCWQFFQSWYGGGPPIPRGTIEIGEENKKVIVEVYPLLLKVAKLKDTGILDNTIQETELVISRKATVKQFKSIACSKLQLTEMDKVRVWNYFTDSLKLMDDAKTLEEETIAHEQRVLIEIQLPTGSWPTDTASTSPAAGSSPPAATEEGKPEPESTDKPKAPEQKEDAPQKAEKKKRRGIFAFLFGGNANHATTAVHNVPANGSSSTSGTKEVSATNGKPGICGLSNLGNTCFMNSALQCLSNTIPLTEYFMSGKYKNDINRSNPLGMKGKIAEEYGSLLKQLWSPSNSNSAVAPRNFKLAIGKYAPQFSGYNQNDSQELLAFLLDGLHEDLNRVLKKQPVETKQLPDKTDEEMAKIFWGNHLKRDQSIIVDTFQGQLKSKLVCPNCNHISICFDPFMYLSLPLPTEKETIIEVLVARYTEPWQLPIKYAVRMDKSAKIDDLKDAVGKMCDIKSSRLVLADLYNCRLYALLTENKSVTSIRPNDVTIAYEMSSTAQDDAFKVQILHRREKKKEGFSYNSLDLFGIPFLIWVELNHTTGKEIYHTVWQRVKSFILKNAPSEVESSALQEEEQNAEQFPFKLSYVTSTGLSCGKCSSMSCNGCTVKYNDKPPKWKANTTPAVAIDWDSKTIKKYFDKDAPNTIKLHPSVEEAKKNSSKAFTLVDCLNLFTTDEKLGANDTWYCPKCKEHHRAMKKFDLWSVPQILVIHLKRFLYSKWSREKLGTLVEFPVEGLDLSSFVLSKSDKAPIYDLFAVSNHSGGLGGGHYTAYAKNKHDGIWYLFNDSSVSPVGSTDSIVSSAAYVLFYTRRQ